MLDLHIPWCSSVNLNAFCCIRGAVLLIPFDSNEAGVLVLYCFLIVPVSTLEIQLTNKCLIQPVRHANIYIITPPPHNMVLFDLNVPAGGLSIPASMT